MIKDSNIQRSVVIPKEVDEKIKIDAKGCHSSVNWVIRRILTDYYGKYKERLDGYYDAQFLIADTAENILQQLWDRIDKGEMSNKDLLLAIAQDYGVEICKNEKNANINN